jgi:hypothetical protein
MSKITLKTAAIALAIGAMATVAVAAERVDHRQHKQDKRIDRGVSSGTLTEREAQRLRNQQNRIQTAEDRAEASGTGTTVREKARLENMQDRASHNIRRQKRDRQRK